MEITKPLISSLAPDASSMAAGESLVRKGSFFNLSKDQDETIIFGECKGSGSKPYAVSVDFMNPESPVARCSCPSRKIPCKHALGLMVSYAEGQGFEVKEVPQDIESKRAKIQKREQKKEDKLKETLESLDNPVETKKNPKKNTAARLKKLDAQLNGLDIAESLVLNILRDGFGSATPKSRAEIEKQAKQMGDHYLPGVQKMLIDLAHILGDEDTESAYTAGYEQITRIYALLKKGREYIHKKKEDPAFIDTSTELEAMLGYAWQLKELLEAGLAEKDACLLQLAFGVYSNEILKQTEETGIWINLKSGEIVKTENIIPFRAQKYISTTDSIKGVLETSVLYNYPGILNRRVRWDGYTLREAGPKDYSAALAHAYPLFAPLVKELKGELKNPLSNKNPFVLVKFKMIGEIEGEAVIEDDAGDRIVLMEAHQDGWLETLNTLRMLGPVVNSYTACVLRFQYLPDSGELRASPMALLNDKALVKLGF